MIKKFDSELESSEAMKLYLKLGNSNEKLGLVGVATEYLETFLAKCSDNEPGKGHARILLADCYERYVLV